MTTSYKEAIQTINYIKNSDEVWMTSDNGLVKGKGQYTEKQINYIIELLENVECIPFVSASTCETIDLIYRYDYLGFMRLRIFSDLKIAIGYIEENKYFESEGVMLPIEYAAETVHKYMTKTLHEYISHRFGEDAFREDDDIANPKI